MTEAGKMLAFALEHRRRGCGGGRFESHVVNADCFEIVCAICAEAHNPDHSVMIEAERLDRDEVFGYVRVSLILNDDVSFTDEEWARMTNVEGFMALCKFLGIMDSDADHEPSRTH